MEIYIYVSICLCILFLSLIYHIICVLSFVIKFCSVLFYKRSRIFSFPFELGHAKIYEMTRVTDEVSCQPSHLCYLNVKLCAIRLKSGSMYPQIAQRRFRSDSANAQADLSVHWALVSFCKLFCIHAHLII